MARGELYSIGISAVLHVAVALAIGWVAVEHVLEPSQEPMIVEFDVVQVEPEIEPEPEPVEPPEVEEPAEPPIPVAPRAPKVPAAAKIAVVEHPRPFSPEGRDVEDGRDAPDDATTVLVPTSPLVFDMDAEVTGTGGGSGRGDFETTSNGTIGVGARGGNAVGGTGGGAPGDVDQLGAMDVKVARDWEVTALPEPLNDGDFEPDYPPVAKREGREATVIVRLFIDAEGKVVDAEVVRGPKRHGFRQAALAYVNKLSFAPARSGATAVASRIDWTVHFYVRN